MEQQLTIRIPKALARAIARQAKARGLKRSQLVREALAKYVAAPTVSAEEESRAIWERVKHYVGSMPLDHDAIMADPIARQIYEHNWRM